MAEISKLSKVAIADVAAVDAVLKADIANLNGLTIPAAGPGVPAAAYSVRLLGSALGVPTYSGACMRVRRDSDNVEADVGFDSNDELSLTSPISNTSDAQSYTDFADFVDHTGSPANGFVRKWYDQSSNTNDAGQATAGSQPKIYDSSTGLISKNGKPAINFAVNMLQVANSTILNAADVSLFATLTITGTARGQIVSNGDSATAKDRFYMYENAALLVGWSGANTGSLATYTTSNQILADYFVTGFETSGTPAVDTHVNGGLASSWTYSSGIAPQTMTGGTESFTIGKHFNINSQFFSGSMQEMVIYHSDQSSNRTGIETNINTYFSIYS